MTSIGIALLVAGLVALAVVGGVLARSAAIARRQLRRDARRMRALADVDQAAHGHDSADEIARALVTLLVPSVVDLCLIDLIGDDGVMRRAAGALDDEPRLLADLMGRRPSELAEVDDDHDGPDLGGASIASSIVIPLAARERVIGAIVLGNRAARTKLDQAGEVEFAATLAARVALAVDNVSLSQELSDTEQRLDVILAAVDAAITVRHIDGRMVYANEAAATLLKAPDAEAVRGFPPGELMDQFDVFSEDGDPVDLADLPGTRLLHGEPAPPPIVVRNVVKATGEERWLLNRATAVTDADGAILMAVNLIEDVTETKRGELGQRLLAQTARAVAETDDLDRTLQAIADAAVPGLADWAAVDVVDATGRIRTVALAHRDREMLRIGWRLRTEWPVSIDDREVLAAVIRTGEPLLVRDVGDELLAAEARDEEQLALMRSVGLRSAMVVPMRAGARMLGTLTFVSSTSRRFDDRDLELASDLGRQAGIFVNSARLHAEQAHIAHTLQAGLIPDRLPALEGWEVSTAYRAAGHANEVGGDFYDVVEFEGGWAAAVGDVVGKGAEAAALTALTRHTLAAIIESTGDVAHALRVLNRRLRERGTDYGSLCTIAVVVVRRGDRAAIYSAGHPLPLLVRDGTAQLVGDTSPMLGVIDDFEILVREVALNDGDRLVLYTDGVLDAVGATDRFGEDRLLETVSELGDDDPAAALLGVVEAFTAGEQSDDIAVVCLERTPVPVSPAGATQRA